MPRTTQKPDEDGEESYLVTDLNARTGPRVHEMMERYVYPNGRHENRPVKYTFRPGEPTEVPRHTALKFALADPSFEVRTPDGAMVRPRTHKTEDGSEFTLEPGQVVAQVDELTTEALHDRAKSLPGAESMPPRPKRVDLIKFVLAGGDDPDDDLGEFERVAPPTVSRPRAAVSDPMQDAINAGDEI